MTPGLRDFVLEAPAGDDDVAPVLAELSQAFTVAA